MRTLIFVGLLGGIVVLLYFAFEHGYKRGWRDAEIWYTKVALALHNMTKE